MHLLPVAAAGESAACRSRFVFLTLGFFRSLSLEARFWVRSEVEDFPAGSLHCVVDLRLLVVELLSALSTSAA